MTEVKIKFRHEKSKVSTALLGRDGLKPPLHLKFRRGGANPSSIGSGDTTETISDTVTLNSGETIAQLKAKIADKIGVLPDHIQIRQSPGGTMAKKKLRDDAPAMEYFPGPTSIYVDTPMTDAAEGGPAVVKQQTKATTTIEKLEAYDGAVQKSTVTIKQTDVIDAAIKGNIAKGEQTNQESTITDPDTHRELELEKEKLRLEFKLAKIKLEISADATVKSVVE
ncbi:hypothetical protein DL769_005386 [Monosporascus sp. CRB-8-3]|nr:hypothetical protein DL769_005386 [Monosporascus sp. CRB-8-3]